MHFSPPIQDNDIALITLAEPAPIGDHIDRLCLPSIASGFTYTGFEATVSGWGLNDGRDYPDELRKVDVKVWDNTQCALSYFNFDFVSIQPKITKRQICANGVPNKDSCEVSSM